MDTRNTHFDVLLADWWALYLDAVRLSHAMCGTQAPACDPVESATVALARAVADHIAAQRARELGNHLAMADFFRFAARYSNRFAA